MYCAMLPRTPPEYAYLQVYRQLRRLINSWTHPRNASAQMYYTVAYDWRRDFYVEAPRVLRALQVRARLIACLLSVLHLFANIMLCRTLRSLMAYLCKALAAFS
jgi:hypothetical protein